MYIIITKDGFIISDIDSPFYKKEVPKQLHFHNKIQHNNLHPPSPNPPIQALRQHLLPSLRHPPIDPPDLPSQPHQCQSPISIRSIPIHRQIRLLRL